MKKKSFLLHLDSLDLFNDLSDEQAGKLIKLIIEYQICLSENKPFELDKIEDVLLRISFKHFKSQFDRENEKYIKIAERNKSNGLKGGRPKKSKTNDFEVDNENPVGYFKNPEKPSGLFWDNDENPKNLDKDNDKDNDKEKISKTLNSPKKKIKKKKDDFDLSFVDENLKEPFNMWLEYKQSLPQKLRYHTQLGVERAYNSLCEYSGMDKYKAQLIVDQSITANYQGIFPLNQMTKVRDEAPSIAKRMMKEYQEDCEFYNSLKDEY